MGSKRLPPKGTPHQMDELARLLDNLGLTADHLQVPDRDDAVQIGFYVSRDAAEILADAAKDVGIRGKGTLARLLVLGYLVSGKLPSPEPRKKVRKRDIR